MFSKQYFAYIRVSTARQGQIGTSLIEQRGAIERHAQRWRLNIVKEFEEQETAAKRGRPVFLSMLKELKQGRATGVIMHKIDRSARNLRDWAELGELIDKGIEVHFANENLDLYSRGGRLSADIQAVVAADYIRNLREEVKKGFYGRLKQGFYPMPAPVGYINKGAGKAKEIDPVQGPLVKKAFELYATGRYGLRTLREKMTLLGLRAKRGQEMSLSGFSAILKNPFYTGIIRLKMSGEIFEGRHLPIIKQALFDRVQNILQGKLVSISAKQRHDFLFRKMVICSFCRYRLIGEMQKGYIYYRCHTKICEQKSIREEIIDKTFLAVLKSLKFALKEMNAFDKWHEIRHREIEAEVKNQRRALELQLEQTNTRISRLTDALVDELVDKETYLEKKNNLIWTAKDLKEKLESVEENELAALRKTKQFLEQLNSAYSSYLSANYTDKCELLQTVTSNFFIKGKFVSIKLNLPFELVVNRNSVPSGGPYRDTPRTFINLFEKLIQHFRQ